MGSQGKLALRLRKIIIFNVLRSSYVKNCIKRDGVEYLMIVLAQLQRFNLFLLDFLLEEKRKNNLKEIDKLSKQQREKCE